MKAEELRGMSDDQLELSLKEATKQLFHLRIQSATERLETPSQMAKVRRDVARIKTIQRQRELTRTAQAPTESATTGPAGK